MGLLASIGRSRVGTDLSDFITAKRNAELNELKTEAYINRSDKLNEITDIEISQKRNQILAEKQERERLSAPEPFEGFLDRFKVPAVQDYVTKLAKAQGLIGPDGSITTGQRERLIKDLQSMHTPQLSQMRVDHAQKQYQLLKRMKNDPEFRKESGFKGSDKDLEMASQSAYESWKAAMATHGKLLDAHQEELNRISNAQIEREKLEEEERKNKAKEDQERKELEEETRKNKAGGTSGGSDRAMKSWTLEDGSVLNIPNNEKPPKGAVPYQHETGRLSEQAVLEDIRELVQYDETLALKWSNRYNEIRKNKNISREEALQQVKDEYTNPTDTEYGYLWE